MELYLSLYMLIGSRRTVLKFRKLLAACVLNDEILFRGQGIQTEGEHFGISVHTPAPPPAFNSVTTLTRIRDMQSLNGLRVVLYSDSVAPQLLFSLES